MKNHRTKEKWTNTQLWLKTLTALPQQMRELPRKPEII